MPPWVGYIQGYSLPGWGIYRGIASLRGVLRWGIASLRGVLRGYSLPGWVYTGLYASLVHPWVYMPPYMPVCRWSSHGPRYTARWCTSGTSCVYTVRLPECALLAPSWTPRGLLSQPLRKERNLRKEENMRGFRPVSRGF